MARPALGLTLLYLRNLYDVSKGTLAAGLGHADTSLIGKWEKGTVKLLREMADFIAEKLGATAEAIDVLLFTHFLLSPEAVEEPPSPVALTPEEWRGINRTVMTAGWTVAAELRPELARERRRQKAESAREEARELWAVLEGRQDAERRELVRVFPHFRSWGVAVQACEASVRRAAHRADEALELALFALFVAGQAEVEPGFKLRLEGYCRGYVGNARRVGNDFDGANGDFARALDLWKQGNDADPPLLGEWRLLSLEASLRREQHRFPEALELIDGAMVASGGEPAAMGRLLLQKSHILEQLSDCEGALSALEQAGPLLEPSGDPNLLFAHRFDTAASLHGLGRFTAAAELLPRVREMAVELRSQLHLLRVVWLEARVNAGLEKKAAAEAGLEQVRGAFTALGLPYDAALASLDLAVLWLEEGRTREVRHLADGLRWIFRAQKIDREALAALALFCEAARRDTATVELTRQVIADIERIRRSASRPEGGARGRG